MAAVEKRTLKTRGIQIACGINYSNYEMFIGYLYCKFDVAVLHLLENYNPLNISNQYFTQH